MHKISFLILSWRSLLLDMIFYARHCYCHSSTRKRERERNDQLLGLFLSRLSIYHLVRLMLLSLFFRGSVRTLATPVPDCCKRHSCIWNSISLFWVKILLSLNVSKWSFKFGSNPTCCVCYHFFGHPIQITIAFYCNKLRCECTSYCLRSCVADGTVSKLFCLVKMTIMCWF